MRCKAWLKLNKEIISIVLAVIIVLVILALVNSNIVRFSDISSAIAYVLVAGIITVLYWGFKQKLTAKIENNRVKEKATKDEYLRKETDEKNSPQKIQHKKMKIRLDEYDDLKFTLRRDDLITGKMTSDGFYNIFFLTESSFRSFKNDDNFKYLEGSENVSHFEPHFEAQRKGIYYLVFENADKKNIVVDIELYLN